LHRFFVDEGLLPDREIRITDRELVHQWRDVFRLKKGDFIILLDNSGLEYEASIIILTRQEAVVSIHQGSQSKNIPEKELYLCASLIKKDKYEWILEKGTEIGVGHFIPILSERSEKKDLNVERGERIIKEAGEQSGRGMLPDIHDIQTLPEALEELVEVPSIALHFEGLPFRGTNFFSEANSLAVFVGPEGGWSDRETAFFKEKNIPLVSLGPQVLRAETAAVVIASLLLL
jgi:16S rRNA (uracil1498-N3)-methyltransferase